MKLESRVFYESSETMQDLRDESIDLLVTSPPYPMIQMWDECFSELSEEIETALSFEKGLEAWRLMHESLDHVWSESFRVLKSGGFACINIGDAARTIGGEFMLYPNHARITSSMLKEGFSSLPMIHWFKPTNAPNKFMGSGMLPSGAYVTMEHEYILIFRKGGRRRFSASEVESRRRSAFFWEERNRWFSDVWDFRGVNQPLKIDKDAENKASRQRSGAFPFELPHRLINMYSVRGDTVLDPFLGTGTSLAAAIVNGRSFTGYETDSGFESLIQKTAQEAAENAAGINNGRINAHNDFMKEREAKKGPAKYANISYGFPVVTRQEIELVLPELKQYNFDERNNVHIAEYNQ